MTTIGLSLFSAILMCAGGMFAWRREYGPSVALMLFGLWEILLAILAAVVGGSFPPEAGPR